MEELVVVVEVARSTCPFVLSTRRSMKSEETNFLEGFFGSMGVKEMTVFEQTKSVKRTLSPHSRVFQSCKLLFTVVV